MNKYLKVDYKLYTIDADGVEHLEEHTKENEPYQFISGLGMVLEDFEENLQNLQTGDKFDFVVKKERAYSPRQGLKSRLRSRMLFVTFALK